MSTYPLIDALSRYWWVVLLRGLVAVAFGTMALVWPGQALVTLFLLYGAYALIDGIATLWTGALARNGWLVFSGILGILVGIGTFFYPGITAIALFFLIAFWAIVRGLFEVVAAVRLRQVTSGKWVPILSGVVSMAFGTLLLVSPERGVVALIWLVAIYALAFGASMIVWAISLHSLPENLDLNTGVA